MIGVTPLHCVKIEDIKGMTMLECFAGTFIDQNNLNRYAQKTLASSCGPQTYFIHYEDRNHKGHWEPFWYREPLSKFKFRTMCIKNCDEKLSYILPRDFANLFVRDNGQWVCLCPLSSNGPSPLKEIDIHLCTKLKNLLCLSCSLCSNIQSLQSLRLSHLESLTAICKEDIANLVQASPPGSMFTHLKDLYISKCHGIKTLLTLSLVPQLQNPESMDVSFCNSMEQIFAVTYDDDDDSIKITLPKLTVLVLRGLPQLKTVCKEILVCKSGFELDITDSPNLCEPRIEYVAL
ncbi:hypothetical protein LR48_Vigan03g096500 [Vigna angularis]|uniref:Disease resistance protein At4g27190-like leucine-rich repeats domain-containing protein n=1 Tax=Phaseolus angularis TaxID=3914 RepID=A0A0L9U433_PHAAN|nr:hypothetical protein LR48_Vigan03g096500 [Vigna angularis]